MNKDYLLFHKPFISEEEIDEIRQKLKLNDEYEIDMIKDYGSIKHFSITKNGITKVFIMGNIYDIGQGHEIVNRIKINI